MGPLIPGLAEELAGAADRLHRRRRRRLQLATAGSLVVVFAAALAVTSTIDAPPAEAGLEITERDGRVEVRLTDVETRPRVVQDALADADIDADVVAVPVSPSIAGRFVTIFASQGGSTVDPVPSDDGITLIGFSVPADFPGHLELTLGRPARPGEAYAATGSALSAGEPLACADLLGHPARELATVAADHPGLDIDVRPLSADGPEGHVPIGEVATGPYADWRILSIETVARDAVSVVLTVDGEPITPLPPPPPVGC